jgi:hypothetical protein
VDAIAAAKLYQLACRYVSSLQQPMDRVSDRDAKLAREEVELFTRARVVGVGVVQGHPSLCGCDREPLATSRSTVSAILPAASASLGLMTFRGRAAPPMSAIRSTRSAKRA